MCYNSGMKILIVDHSCHKRTNSVSFFQELLMKCFKVETHYYDECYKCNIPADKIAWADVIVFWEFLQSRFTLGVPGKRCVFVPMYDNEWGSKWQWRRLAISKMKVLSFCRKLTEHAGKNGIGMENLLNVRFSYSPVDFVGMSGDSRKVILWERGEVTFDAVKQMFHPEDVDSVIIVRRKEENVAYAPISKEDKTSYKVEVKYGGFLPKDEYMDMISQAGIYIAPRLKEGIGMSFLEQMAMGKCVISHDEATMNEYIRSGENGILVDMGNPRHISKEEIETVRLNVCNSVCAMYGKWENDKYAIIEFFEEINNSEVLGSPWNIKSLIMYPIYLCEGALMRLMSRCKSS